MYVNAGCPSSVHPVPAPVLGGGGQRSLSADPSGERQLPQGGESHDADTGNLSVYACIDSVKEGQRGKQTPRFRH